MTELNRTLVFVVAAIVTAGAAIATNYRPAATSAAIKDRREGEQFYPDFADPNAATSLKVAAYSEADAKLKQFSVEFKDKLWVIPSHNNYPADGKTRLAETAASIVGIKRDEWHGNREEDYATLGVVDPLSPTATKGRGQRITLSKGSDLLADYIIGKQVKSRNGYYYVRRPDEKSVYVARLNVNLSTKFSDWVETDLLLLDQNDVTSVLVDNYKIENDAITPGEKVELSRAKPADKWKLDGLDATKEQLDETKVSSMLGTLDSLTLVGVRAKPAGLSKSLKANDGGIKLTESTLIDLQRKGYFFTRNSELFSRNGEISVTTNKGVRYALRLGDVVVGDESMIEIGIEADKAAEKDAAVKAPGTDVAGKDKDAAASEKAADKTGDAAEPKPGEQTSRYVFVLAQFDPELLGPKPVPPEKPTATKAEETSEKPADGKTGDAATDGDAAKSDDAAKAADDGKSETAKAADAAAKATADEVAYKTALQRYELDLKDYEKKVKDGEELVRKLNVRFADWYYVISADTLAKLRLQKTELIKSAGDKRADAVGNGAGAAGAAGAIDPFSGELPSGVETEQPTEPAATGSKSPETTDGVTPEKAAGDDAAFDGAAKEPTTPAGTEPPAATEPSGTEPSGTEPDASATGTGEAPAGEGAGGGEPGKNP